MDHLRAGVCDQLDQHSEALSLPKIQKLAGPRGVPATWEAKVGESLEPRRQRLQ